MQILLVGLAALTILTPAVHGQVPFAGRCPNVQVQQNFRSDAYLGLWYEFKKYFAVFQAGGTCVTALYSNEGNGVVGVNNRQYSKLRGRYTSIMGSATLTSNNGEGKLAVRFPSAGNFPGNYWVLGTDYSRYAVVWSCTDLLLFNLQFSWVLTRDKFPSSDVLADADAVLRRNGIALKPFSKTSQTDCA